MFDSINILNYMEDSYYFHVISKDESSIDKHFELNESIIG